MKKSTAYIAIGLGSLLLLSFKRGSKLSNIAISASEHAFGFLNAPQKDAIDAIVRAFDRYGDGDGSKLAYILATAWHESRFKPVRECFASTDGEARDCVKNRSYGHEVNGHVYYGRGFVQLTWLENYQKMGNIFNVNLAKYPDKALGLTLAANILVYGMMQGSFTGRKLSEYIKGSRNDFYNARRVVNGLDRAQLINDYTIDIVNYEEVIV